ncbi:NAD(P)H-binding protein [Palleronia rufa]|uniref:NAD(P)H-binding protein n=1 Tax=Palleronia rufa TaxID=1530186 RepID=UPI000562D793|nr:NAD(P)H-binding protein [Palleronia rufa]
MARVLLLGATGTIGRAAATALAGAGHDVVCALRRDPGDLPAEVRLADVTRPGGLAEAMGRDGADAVVSCLGSRTGLPQDAWAVDFDANRHALDWAEAAGAARMVYLSAICVQKPRLVFQHAKMTMEATLRASRLEHVILRPTAFFKSLSGQIARVRAGRRFLLFGDGRLTACKPISDRDLGAVLARAVTEPGWARRTLPVGGPGPALTPLDQAETLFSLLDRAPAVRHVPPGLLSGAARALDVAGRLSPGLAARAELARIGHYYATESMLVWDAAAGRYDAEATPEYGADTLRDHYARVLRGEVAVDLGDHAMF